MKKIITIFIVLVSTVSVKPMALQSLVKTSARMPQKLATVGSKQSMYEYAIAPAVIAGTLTMAANFKLISEIEKIESKITKNFNEDAKIKNIEMLILENEALNKLMYSHLSISSAMIIGGFGNPYIACAGVSSYLTLSALLNTYQGFNLSHLANKKIDFLIQEKKESK